MIVMDDGWFGKREDDNSGLGDWQVNEKKLGCTLKELTEKVNEKGVAFGIWIEPEMVSEDSELYRNHPDWVLRIPICIISHLPFQSKKMCSESPKIFQKIPQGVLCAIIKTKKEWSKNEH